MPSLSQKIPTNFCLKVDHEISLSLPALEDASELFSLVHKNRTYLRKFLGWVDATQKIDDSKEFIAENLPLWLDMRALHLSIKKDKELIGAVGFHQVDFVNYSTFIGYWLDQRHQGQGIMTKSVKALIDYGVKTWQFHRLQILCAIANKASEKVAVRLGFQKEGILKDAIYHYGVFFDANLYSLIVPHVNT